jgi:hydroxymethylglutaryl-CoA lyase
MRQPVTVNEVGLRDGLQSCALVLGTDAKLALVRALVAAGLRHIEATSFVNPALMPQMADAEALMGRLPSTDIVRYTALAFNERGYRRAVAAGARSIATVVGATDALNRRNVNMSLERTTETASCILRTARSDGLNTRAYIAAAFACPYEGPTSPESVLNLAASLIDAGADELAIADTTGAGNPRQAKDLLGQLVLSHGAQRVAAHFHDTRAMGTAMTWAALEAGVRRFDGSIGGLGGCPFAPGASGNLATEDLVFLLEECGFDTGVDLSRLLTAMEHAERLTKQKLGGRILSWYRSGRVNGPGHSLAG